MIEFPAMEHRCARISRRQSTYITPECDLSRPGLPNAMCYLSHGARGYSEWRQQTEMVGKGEPYPLVFQLVLSDKGVSAMGPAASTNVNRSDCHCSTIVRIISIDINSICTDNLFCSASLGLSFKWLQTLPRRRRDSHTSLWMSPRTVYGCSRSR
jgi:hypothetical protein